MPSWTSPRGKPLQLAALILSCITLGSCARSAAPGAHAVAGVRATQAIQAAQLGLPDKPLNLQVLPETSSTRTVFAQMRVMASALGVTCEFCHLGSPTSTDLDSIDFASDEKPTKQTARRMMKLVEVINRELDAIRPAGTPRALRVSCISCHRASPRPLMLEDTLGRVIASAGADSAVRTYAALRTRYFGRFAYDFGERSLTTLGTSLAAAGNLTDARRMLELNEVQFPDSWNVANELARLYERLGEPQLALAKYRRVLELIPTLESARARVDALSGAQRPPR